MHLWRKFMFHTIHGYHYWAVYTCAVTEQCTRVPLLSSARFYFLFPSFLLLFSCLLKYSARFWGRRFHQHKQQLYWNYITHLRQKCSSQFPESTVQIKIIWTRIGKYWNWLFSVKLLFFSFFHVPFKQFLCIKGNFTLLFRSTFTGPDISSDKWDFILMQIPF
jgi:hypothetical protein